MIPIPYQKELILPEQPAGRMDHFGWMNNDYTPPATFYWVYNENALRIRLTCAVDRLTVHTTEDDGPVWEDNCMEFFWQPQKDAPIYYNFECNPLGCMVIESGTDRRERRRLTAALKPKMDVQTTIFPGKGWAAEYRIPFCAIGASTPKKGDSFRFNVYICGEKTPQMHFGSCFPIDTPQPDFHRPEFFGTGVFD